MLLGGGEFQHLPRLAGIEVGAGLPDVGDSPEEGRDGAAERRGRMGKAWVMAGLLVLQVAEVGERLALLEQPPVEIVVRGGVEEVFVEQGVGVGRRIMRLRRFGGCRCGTSGVSWALTWRPRPPGPYGTSKKPAEP